jgi:F-type H+-transporting ATPase subunit c
MTDLSVLKYIGVGLCALGMMGAALGVGNVFSSVVEGIARNPSASKDIKGAGILGAALAEAMGIFSFVVMLILIFVAK